MHWSLYHQLRPLHPQKEGGSQHLCPLARWQHHALQSHRNLGHSLSPRLGLRSSHFPKMKASSLISIGLLCDHGCSATFTATAVTIMKDGNLVLSGSRSPITRLWSLDFPGDTRTPSLASQPKVPVSPSTCYANAVVATDTVADRVAFMHASMFSPSISTCCKAINAGYLSSWPGLTAKQVRQHQPHPAAMVQGHLDQQRAGLRSTQTPPAPVAAAVPDDPLRVSDMHPPVTKPPAQRSHFLYVACESVTGQIYTDPTGRFLVPSSSGTVSYTHLTLPTICSV